MLLPIINENQEDYSEQDQKYRKEIINLPID
jgi:hypothetical protein